MQNFGKWIGAGAIVMAGLTSVTGCNKAGEPDATVENQVATNSSTAVANVANAAAATTSNAVADVSNAASTASNTVSSATNNAVKDVSNAASSASNTVSSATSNAVNSVGGMLKTGEIKSKIIGNASLNNPKNHINVDSTGTSVTLSGSVQNAAQKTLAGSIATQNAGGRKVANNLTVSGGASATMKKQ